MTLQDQYFHLGNSSRFITVILKWYTLKPEWIRAGHYSVCLLYSPRYMFIFEKERRLSSSEKIILPMVLELYGDIQGEWIFLMLLN